MMRFTRNPDGSEPLLGASDDAIQLTPLQWQHVGDPRVVAVADQALHGCTAFVLGEAQPATPSAVLQTLCIHRLASCPNAQDGIRRALSEAGPLSLGLLVSVPGVEFIVGVCEPAVGLYNPDDTEVTLADDILPVFEKVQVLPHAATVKHSAVYLYHEHIAPYFRRRQAGKITEGFDFAFDGVRLRVVCVQPDKSFGVIGMATEVFYDGPPVPADRPPVWAPLRPPVAYCPRSASLEVIRRMWVHLLEGSANEAGSVRQALRDKEMLSAGLLVSVPEVELIVGVCEPAIGRYDPEGTEVFLGESVLPVFDRIKILSSRETVQHDRDFMYYEHLLPYLRRRQVGAVGPGFKFSYDGVDFIIDRASPADLGRGVVGEATEVVYAVDDGPLPVVRGR